MSLNIDFNNIRSLGSQNEGFEELVCSWRAECMSQPASASCAMDGLTADLSLMEIPKGQMRFSLQAADRDLNYLIICLGTSMVQGVQVIIKKFFLKRMRKKR